MEELPFLDFKRILEYITDRGAERNILKIGTIFLDQKRILKIFLPGPFPSLEQRL